MTAVIPGDRLTPDRCLAGLRRAMPQLAIDDVRPFEGGQNGVVLLINGTRIYRFPRFAAGIAALAREAAVLNACSPHLSLPVPQPDLLFADDPVPGAAFISYPFLPGVALWRTTWEQLRTPAAERQIAGQLGRFLRELHACDPSQVPVDLPQGDSREEWADIYGRIRRQLYAFMRPDACRHVSDLFERWLAGEGTLSYRPVLRHGDFGTGNLLIDPHTHLLCGVLDFTDCTLGDPAIDIAGLANGFGPDFLRLVADVYPAASGMRDRVAFYREAFVLEDALYGAEHDDPQAFAAGTANYR